MQNNIGPRIDPWGTSDVAVNSHDLKPLHSIERKEHNKNDKNVVYTFYSIF